MLPCSEITAQAPARWPTTKASILLPVCLPGSEKICRPSPVPSHAGLIAFSAHHALVATFGVRQPCCRASRAHDPARGTPLTLLITVIPCVLVTIVESVSNEQDNFQEMFFEIGSIRPINTDHLQPSVNVCDLCGHPHVRNVQTLSPERLHSRNRLTPDITGPLFCWIDPLRTEWIDARIQHRSAT